MSAIELYGAAASAALGVDIIGAPDSAYLIKSTYVFNAAHGLSTVLAGRSVDGGGTAIPDIAVAGVLSAAGFPTTWTAPAMTFVGITTPDVAAVLLANTALGQPIALLPLGSTFALTAEDFVVAVVGAAIEVHT